MDNLINSNVTIHKLVFLGNAAVGKSCLAVRFVRNEFFEFQEPTIGAAFLTQTMVMDGSAIKFEIWDTAGQERYRSLAPMYYRGAAAAVVVYDVTDRETYDGAKSWVKELQRRGDQNIIVALAGNKADDEENRAVNKEEASAYAAENGLLFFETSAKSGQNVNEVFHALASKLPKHVPVDSKKSVLAAAAEDSQPSNGCC